MGQGSKIAFAGYITEKAGGIKEAYFSKPAQEEFHDVQMVGLVALMLLGLCGGDPMLVPHCRQAV